MGWAVARIENLRRGCPGGQSVSVASDDNPGGRVAAAEHDVRDLTAGSSAGAGRSGGLTSLGRTS
jgi:hypothetical protein